MTATLTQLPGSRPMAQEPGPAQCVARDWPRPGATLARLRSDLAALGIQRRCEVRETEDHAAALCETMAIICSHPSEVGLETQKAFFSDHLKGWMDCFFKDMQQASAARFYRAVGRLGEAFLDLEKTYLGL